MFQILDTQLNHVIRCIPTATELQKIEKTYVFLERHQKTVH